LNFVIHELLKDTNGPVRERFREALITPTEEESSFVNEVTRLLKSLAYLRDISQVEYTERSNLTLLPIHSPVCFENVLPLVTSITFPYKLPLC
jgi:hypothetical protein